MLMKIFKFHILWRLFSALRQGNRAPAGLHWWELCFGKRPAQNWLSTYKQIIQCRVTFPYFSGHLTGGLDDICHPSHSCKKIKINLGLVCKLTWINYVKLFILDKTKASHRHTALTPRTDPRHLGFPCIPNSTFKALCPSLISYCSRSIGLHAVRQCERVENFTDDAPLL